MINLKQLLEMENIKKYQVCWYGMDIAKNYIGEEGLLKPYVLYKNKNPYMNQIYIILYGTDGKRSKYMFAIRFTEKLGELIDGNVCFKWERVPLKLDDYSGRLILRKDTGYSFYNNIADGFIVDEIYPPKLNRKVPFFASYDEVELSFTELKEIVENRYADYYKHLSCVKGIYMIIDGNTGKQYIGSASGEEGLYGRWKSYAESYHGKNEELVKLFNKEGPEYFHKFKYIILQILPLKMTSTEITKIETKYKNKYLTKEFGLNDN